MRKCQFYLDSKKRNCKFEAKPGYDFCGNHMPNNLQPTRKRIRCPWDPSHTVFESEVAQHAFKCPSHLLQLKNQAQAFCQADVNAGSPEDNTHATATKPVQHNTAARQPTVSSAQLRHQYVQALSSEQFQHLVLRIGAAHAEACPVDEPLQHLEPEVCSAYMQPDNMRPFSLKHAQQQASIVGHMHQAGLLKNAEGRVYLEFGAGKGYLSSMLADASKARNFVLLDVRGFRNKADRSLRKLEALHLQRLTCDIKDFQPAGVEGLSKGQKPWVATGKHLCGAATDFTLRCCASSMQHSSSHLQQQQKPSPSHLPQASAPQGATSGSRTFGGSHSDHGNNHMHSAEQAQRGALAAKQHLVSAEQGSSGAGAAGMAAATDTEGCSSEPLRTDAAEDGVSCHGRDDQVLGEAGVQGFAVATCCHHRCCWQHYVGKPLFKRLKFSPDEFEIISWMTGWALCGHETPAGQAQGDPRENTQGKSQAQEAPHRPASSHKPDATSTQGTPADTRPAADNCISSTADCAEPCPTFVQLSRDERIVLGQKCKQLIDAGRKDWLLQQGFQAKSVLYIDPCVSGENQLLLGIRSISQSPLPLNRNSC